MPLRPETVRRLDARWADEYGVGFGFFTTARTDVAPRAGDAGWAGLFVFRRGDACLVQAPPALGAQAARWIGGRSPAVLLDPGFWAGRLGPRFARAVGPAWLGYTDAPTGLASAARRLGPADAEALRALEAAVGPTAWEHGGLRHGAPDTWGLYDDGGAGGAGGAAGGALVAAGAIARWHGGLGHVGIVSHPAHRGRGHARAVVAAMTDAGLAAGLVMQYRTLEANLPSVAIAERLGFVRYASTLSVRLAEAEAGDHPG